MSAGHRSPLEKLSKQRGSCANAGRLFPLEEAHERRPPVAAGEKELAKAEEVSSLLPLIQKKKGGRHVARQPAA